MDNINNLRKQDNNIPVRCSSCGSPSSHKKVYKLHLCFSCFYMDKRGIVHYDSKGDPINPRSK